MLLVVILLTRLTKPLLKSLSENSESDSWSQKAWKHSERMLAPIYLILYVLDQLGRCRPSGPWIRSSHSAFCKCRYRLGNLPLGFGFHPKPGLAPPHSRDRIRPGRLAQFRTVGSHHGSTRADFFQGRRPYDFGTWSPQRGSHFAFSSLDQLHARVLRREENQELSSLASFFASTSDQNSPCPFGFSLFHRGSLHDRLGSLFLRFAWWSNWRRDWIRASKVVSNLVSGLILLLDRSIKPGDVIEIDGTYGWINSLRARYASVITRDGKEHLIPNEDLITNRVVNWSFSDRNVRVRVPLGISYENEPREAIRLCLEASRSVDRTLQDPEPRCLLTGFGDNSVNLELRFWIDDPSNGVGNVRVPSCSRFGTNSRKTASKFPTRNATFISRIFRPTSKTVCLDGNAAIRNDKPKLPSLPYDPFRVLMSPFFLLPCKHQTYSSFCNL